MVPYKPVVPDNKTVLRPMTATNALAGKGKYRIEQRVMGIWVRTRHRPTSVENAIHTIHDLGTGTWRVVDNDTGQPVKEEVVL